MDCLWHHRVQRGGAHACEKTEAGAEWQIVRNGERRTICALSAPDLRAMAGLFSEAADYVESK